MVRGGVAVLVVIRFRPTPSRLPGFQADARAVLALLADRPGWRSGRIGRAADDPGLWVLTTEWESVGAYRRAMSAQPVRILAMPLMAVAIDEPTAYEVLEATGLGADGLAAPSALADER
jgi:quinol monooxygenase YgiN